MGARTNEVAARVEESYEVAAQVQYSDEVALVAYRTKMNSYEAAAHVE